MKRIIRALVVLGAAVLGLYAAVAYANGSYGGNPSLGGGLSTADKAKVASIPTTVSWRDSVLQHLQAVDPALTSLPWSSDANNVAIDWTVQGTGYAHLETSVTNGGSILLGTTTTSNNFYVLTPHAVINSDNGTTINFVSDSRTQHWAVCTLMQAVSAPSNPSEELMFGMWFDSVYNIGIGIQYTSSTTHWLLRYGSAGASFIDLGVAFDASPHIACTVNDTTNVKAYLDWVQVGAALASSNIGSGGGSAKGYPRWYAQTATAAHDVQGRIFWAAIATSEP